tara:strand:+ start:85 stop:279 length:195 start_codon:yes stop_codon:yes gene_type:complete
MLKKLDKLKNKVVQFSRLRRRNIKTLNKLKHEIVKKNFGHINLKNLLESFLLIILVTAGAINRD